MTPTLPPEGRARKKRSIAGRHRGGGVRHRTFLFDRVRPVLPRGPTETRATPSHQVSHRDAARPTVTANDPCRGHQHAAEGRRAVDRAASAALHPPPPSENAPTGAELRANAHPYA